MFRPFCFGMCHGFFNIVNAPGGHFVARERMAATAIFPLSLHRGEGRRGCGSIRAGRVMELNKVTLSYHPHLHESGGFRHNPLPLLDYIKLREREKLGSHSPVRGEGYLNGKVSGLISPYFYSVPNCAFNSAINLRDASENTGYAPGLRDAASLYRSKNANGSPISSYTASLPSSSRMTFAM